MSNGQGMSTYRCCLQNARATNTVGENYHSNPNVKPGRIGRKLSKKAKQELALKMAANVKRVPSLAPAALNLLK